MPSDQRLNFRLNLEEGFRSVLHEYDDGSFDVLEYADGARETILTDGSEKCTRTSPIQEAGIYNGCVYDARLEGREPCDWLPVHVEADDVVVSPPLGPFIRELAVER